MGGKEGGWAGRQAGRKAGGKAGRTTRGTDNVHFERSTNTAFQQQVAARDSGRGVFVVVVGSVMMTMCHRAVFEKI